MRRHFWEVFGTFREVARLFVTAFCVRVLASLSKDLARVGVRLKLEVFISSSLLIQGSELKAKVQVRLTIEGGLI